MAEESKSIGRKSPPGDFLVSTTTLILDALAIGAALFLSYWLRFSTPLFESLGFVHEEAPAIDSYVTGGLFVMVLWLTLFQSRKMYSARRSVTLTDELFSVIKVVSLGMLMVASAAFFYRGFSFSRVVFALLWVNATACIYLSRAAVFWLERRAYRKGRHLRHAVILGADERAENMFTRLHNHPSFGFHFIGYFADHPADESSALHDALYLGPVTDASRLIRDKEVNLAFIALGAEDHERLFDFIGDCEGLNIDFLMVPDVLEVLTSQMQLTEFEGVPLLRIKSIPFTLWGRVIKRGFDLVVASVLLLLLSPLFLLIGIFIKISSKGPVLFKQERVGMDGQRFVIFKFRTMKQGSELKDGETGLGIKNDPRRFGFGIVLRKTGLDELPQLLNVLRGEMSIVGPRPERTPYVDQFKEVVPKYLDRHRVKTGITGWAQVNGLRGDTSIEERVRFDLYYIENWSLWMDIKIILRTIRTAFDFKHVH